MSEIERIEEELGRLWILEKSYQPGDGIYARIEEKEDEYKRAVNEHYNLSGKDRIVEVELDVLFTKTGKVIYSRYSHAEMMEFGEMDEDGNYLT